MITVLFFAQLRENLACDQLIIEPEQSLTVKVLRKQLIEQHPDWEDALLNEAILVAVNQEIAAFNTLLHSGDEVAFFLPVTGG